MLSLLESLLFLVSLPRFSRRGLTYRSVPLYLVDFAWQNVPTACQYYQIPLFKTERPSVVTVRYLPSDSTWQAELSLPQLDMQATMAVVIVGKSLRTLHISVVNT